jgi:transposase, IS30 family
MPKGYQQLTYEQRCQIYALKSRGDSNRKIARQLNVHPSTIDRELIRNSGKRGYRFKQAEAKSQKRRHRRTGRNMKMTLDLIALIKEKLTRYQWSPEQIAGWLEREQGRKIISHERIYQYIWTNKKAGGTLYTHLRRRAKKYVKRVNGKSPRGQIVGRIGIENRPAIVETRSRIGDWEADTIVGKAHQGAIVRLVERKTRYTLLIKVERSTAEAVQLAITTALAPFPVHSITFDNGKEFAQHLSVAETLKTTTFFARPYHSWERGTNENTNGLVRQYIPKKTDFATVSHDDVARIEQLLNTRPRKCLRYDTPQRAIQLAA